MRTLPISVSKNVAAMNLTNGQFVCICLDAIWGCCSASFTRRSTERSNLSRLMGEGIRQDVGLLNSDQVTVGPRQRDPGGGGGGGGGGEV